MIRIVATVLLVLHGCAHLLGFAASWQIATFDDIPYTTFIANGALDAGDVGIRVIASAWIVAGGAMVLAAILVWRRSVMALRALWIATAVSLVVCVLGLPDAVLGVAIDVSMVAALVVVSVRPRRSTSWLVDAR